MLSTIMCEKFHYDQLRNDRSLGNRKSDNKKKKKKKKDYDDDENT